MFEPPPRILYDIQAVAISGNFLKVTLMKKNVAIACQKVIEAVALFLGLIYDENSKANFAD